MSGSVVVGGVAYPNSWLPDGKTIRQVICPLCEDKGRIPDDDGEPGVLCDCRIGEDAAQAAADLAYTPPPAPVLAQPRPTCKAVCATHGRRCYLDVAEPHGVHYCSASRHPGGPPHGFYAGEVEVVW